MQMASGSAILSHPRFERRFGTPRRNPERERGARSELRGAFGTLSVSEWRVRNPERERGAVLAGFVYRHGFALFTDNILDRCPNGVSGPEVAGAAVSSPAATIGTVDRSLVQATTAVRLHRVQYQIWFAVCRHNQVDMICTNVRGQKRPATKSAHIPNAFQYDPPANRIEQIAVLHHSASGLLLLPSIRFRKRSPESIPGSWDSPGLAG